MVLIFPKFFRQRQATVPFTFNLVMTAPIRLQEPLTGAIDLMGPPWWSVEGTKKEEETVMQRVNLAEKLALFEKVKFRYVDDAPEVLGLIDQEVMGLVARIFGGGQRQEIGSTQAP